MASLEEAVSSMHVKYFENVSKLRDALLKHPTIDANDIIASMPLSLTEDAPGSGTSSSMLSLNTLERSLLDQVLNLRKQFHVSSNAPPPETIPVLQVDKRAEFLSSILEWALTDSAITLPEILKSVSKVLLARCSIACGPVKDSIASTQSMLDTVQFVRANLLAEHDRLISTENMYLRRIGRPAIPKSEIPQSLAAMNMQRPKLLLSLSEKASQIERGDLIPVESSCINTTHSCSQTVGNQTRLSMSDMNIFSDFELGHMHSPTDAKKSVREYIDFFRDSFLHDVKEHPDSTIARLLSPRTHDERPDLHDDSSLVGDTTCFLVIELKAQLADAQARLALHENNSKPENIALTVLDSPKLEEIPPEPEEVTPPISPRVRTVFEALYDDAKARMQTKQAANTPRTSARRLAHPHTGRVLTSRPKQNTHDPHG